MSLLDRHGEKVDGWVRVEGAAIAGVAQPVVAYEHLPAAIAARQGNQSLGVFIENNVKRDDLKTILRDVQLIAIRFPSFSDGRGFSIAKALRGFGFAGTLRAVGPLIPDQFTYALDCGFDEIELPAEHAARQPVAQWLKAEKQFTATYQRGYGEEGSILDQRRAARNGG